MEAFGEGFDAEALSQRMRKGQMEITFRWQRLGWRTRMHIRHFTKELVGHIGLIIVSICFFFPFYWMVTTSLKPDAEIFSLPPTLWPSQLVWSNYPNALSYIPFFTYLWNTAYITVFNVAATVISCAIVAYGFSHIEWPGRDQIFVVLLSTMMIPYHVTLIPTYVIFHWIGWVNSFNALTWPAWFGNPFFIFLLRQFFLSIPRELSDAARIDGANEWDIFTRLIVPLSVPALATTALFTFMFTWNDFLGPLIFLNDQDKYTLALGIYGYLKQHGAEWAYLMSAAVVMTLPVIVVFFFTQRTFIQGITLTGLKE
jgi:multiple sugar transport system permease protein